MIALLTGGLALAADLWPLITCATPAMIMLGWPDLNRNDILRLREVHRMAPSARRQSGRPSASATHAPGIVSAVTLMVDLIDDGTVSGVVGIMDPYTRRYRFVSLPRDGWGGEPRYAMHAALKRMVFELAMDPEVPVEIPS